MRKGVINFVENNTTKMQTVQVNGIAGETSSGAEHFQPFGFSSFIMPIDANTGKGAECLIDDVFSNGHTTVLCATDRRYRPTVANPGDVILFSTHDVQTANHNDATQRLVFTDDGTENYRFLLKINNAKVEVKSSGDILLTNGSSTIQLLNNGTININGDVNITGTVKANGKVIDNTHKHSGVQAGSAQTGVVV
jgi:phage gp45-like